MNDTVTAKTIEEASGVEAQGNIAAYYIYYDPCGHQLVVVSPALHVNIVNEDNFLNAAMEEMHDANAQLELARSACLQAIDDAPSPSQVNPSIFDQLVQNFDDAQRLSNEKRQAIDEIHKSLDSIDGPEIKPLHEVKAIRELIPVASSSGRQFEGKVRYVRPSTAFARANNLGSVEWSEVDIEEKETNFFHDNKFDSEVFKQEVMNLFSMKSVTAKIEHDFSKDFLPTSLQMQSGFLAKFAENWSTALQYDSDKACAADPNMTQEQCMDRIFSFSAAAQFLRYTHGVGIKGDFDIKSLRASIKAEGRAELALLEAKSKFTWQIPDRRGWMLSLPARDGVNADLGLIRFVFEILLSGFVGASIAGEVSVSVNAAGLVKGCNSENNNPAPDPMGNRFDFENLAVQSEAKAGAEIGAFAGAEGTADFSLAIQWKNPEEVSKYAAFAKYVIGVTGQAGIGAQAKFSVGYEQGVGFYIEARAGLCFGYGAKGSMKLNIDALLIGEFLLWFAYQLRNVDFQYIRDLISDEDYNNLCYLQVLLISGTYVLQGAQLVVGVLGRIADDYRGYRDRVKLMNRILDDARGRRVGHRAEQVRYATPEAKGNILWMLTDTSYWDNIGWDVQKQNPLDGEAWLGGSYKWLKKAVVTVLYYTQSKAEYRNIMQHMSASMGVKGDWQANERRLLEFLDAGELNHWMFQWAFTDYDGEFKEWFESLPEVHIYLDPVEIRSSKGDVSFYDYLPERTSPGTSIDDSLLANRMYAFNSNYTPPVYVAAEFTNCCAPDVWDDQRMA